MTSKMQIRYQYLKTPFKIENNEHPEYVDSVCGWNSEETWKLFIKIQCKDDWLKLVNQEVCWVEKNVRRGSSQVLASRLNKLYPNSKNVDWLQLSDWYLGKI